MKNPNIIFMISHDTGRYLNCYGHQVETPELNRLAEEGVRFDRYFCPSPQCSPSRGSILTGRYPHNNGLIGLAHLGFHIDENITTLPMALQNAGYETSLIGFSHETIGETEQGVTSSTNQLGYDRYEEVPGSRSPEVAKRSIELLKEKADGSSDQPFFLNIGFEETHRPFGEYESYEDHPDDIEVLPYLPDTPNVRKDLAQFHGSVKVLDQAVGDIVRSLKELNLEENTIVIYTTDHGIAFPRAKGTLKEVGLETALICYSPKLVNGGRVVSELLCNVDIMPTLLDLGGVDIPEGLDGKSFAPLLKGADGEGREEFFCELTWHDKYHPMRGIHTNRYKFIRNFEDGPKIYMPYDIHSSLSGQDVREEFYVQNEPEELYDLENDPLEEQNLIHDSSYSEVAETLRGKLRNWMESTNDPLLNGPVPGIQAPEWDGE
ncbi:MAG TPA: sulfatase [Bacillales bacterium]|nr:sulfatase [Bacillales bacterium]